jgi:hypothetical protein
MTNFKVGNIVLTQTFNYLGIITKCFHNCPEENSWLAKQSIPIRAESVRYYWYKISVFNGCEVMIPHYDIRNDMKITN